MRPIMVPYISQWDESAHLSRGDCGIVCACMIANWKDLTATPDWMLQAAKLPVGRHAYSFSEIIQAAVAVGLHLRYQTGATWDAIRPELDAGRPVISLIRYGELSGNQDDFDGAHFVVVTSYSTVRSGVFIHDPDWWRPRRDGGNGRFVPLDEFRSAIGRPLVETGNQAYQALFVNS